MNGIIKTYYSLAKSKWTLIGFLKLVNFLKRITHLLQFWNDYWLCKIKLLFGSNKIYIEYQSYFKFDELHKSFLYDELAIIVQKTFRNYYYSFNFLLLIFPIQIYQHNLWKSKTKANSIPSVDVILDFDFFSNIPPRDKLHLTANTSREMCIAFSISLLYLKKDWFTSCFFSNLLL